MKKDKIIFILIGIGAVCFAACSLFFVMRGFLAHDKQNEYFDLYRAEAREYIESDPEICEKYGEDISVEFDTYSYSYAVKRRAIDKYIEVFFPWKPETVEEFNQKLDEIDFNVMINGDPYNIVLEKNMNGEFEVVSLTEVDE